MGTTPNRQLPYPELTDQANVPADMQELALALDTSLYDTGWITGSGSNLFVPNATNFTLGSSVVRSKGGVVAIYLSGSMKVASAAPGTTGDIANITLGQFVAAYRPAAGAPTQGLTTGPWGRPLVPFLDSTGSLVIGAITGTIALAVGESISVGGTYLL
jgi:hypothetical protein